MEIKLSFIIPVYNVENYLEECLNSILSQITDDCEIILVNDGSTDNSGLICDNFSVIHKNISVIKKENEGLAKARNTGLSVAVGKYIVFIDSDDKIYDDSIKVILEWIEDNDADICFLQCDKIYPNGSIKNMGDGIYHEQLSNCVSLSDVYDFLSTRPKFPGSSWAKLYKRDFLMKKSICFPLDNRYAEDLGFVRDCLFGAESFDCLDMPFYMYRQNRIGSITSSFSLKKFFDLGLFVSESADMFCKNKKPTDIKSKYFMSFVAYEYIILVYNFSKLSKNDRLKVKDFLKQYKWTMKYGHTKKIKTVKHLVCLFGLRFTSFLLNVVKK